MLYVVDVCRMLCILFFFQAEDGIRDLVRSRGLGDVYKRQPQYTPVTSLVSLLKPGEQVVVAETDHDHRQREMIEE